MGYRVKVYYKGLKRLYGTGSEGKGMPYKSIRDARRRAEKLKKEYARLQGVKITLTRKQEDITKCQDCPHPVVGDVEVYLYVFS